MTTKHVLAVAMAGILLVPGGSEAQECDTMTSHPEWVFCHDFEAPDADDFDTYWNDMYGAPERVFLQDGGPQGIAGSHFMRMQIVNDTDDDFTSGVTSGPKKFLGDVVDWEDLYFRRYVRFNDDFHQGNFMHLGGMSACHPSLYPWGCMGHAGERPAGDDRFSTNLEPWSDWMTLPWPGRWGFYSYYHQMYMDCGHPGPDDCYGDMFAPAEDFLFSRGEWHVLEMTIHPSTPGGTDGTQTFWADGERIYTAEGIAWRTTGELRINQVGLYLYIHYNPARTTNILDLDNVLISREYIGPAPCADGVEIGSPCLCGGTPEPDDASNVFSTGWCCSGAWQATSCGPEPDGPVEPPPDGAPDAPPDASSDTAGDPQDAGTDGGANGGQSTGCGCTIAV